MAFSVVIPSRNAANLVPCIRAIREADETCEIIVVDDGLTVSGVYDVFDASAPPRNRVQIVTGVKPFCFSRNVNLGIQAAGEDDVIVLNDDELLKTPKGFTLLQSEATDELANLEYGIIAASCDTVGNPNQFRRGDGLLRDEPRMVCFVCVYIPRSTINAVGLLDERFVDYGMEDDDYSLRVRNAGLKIGIYDGCYVDHGSLKSSFRGEANAGGDFRPNLTRFIEKWSVDNRGKSYAESEWKAVWPKGLIPA